MCQEFEYSQRYISFDEARTLLGLKGYYTITETLKRAGIPHFKKLVPYQEECGLKCRRWLYQVDRLELLRYLYRYEEVVYQRKKKTGSRMLRRARGVR